MNEARWKVTAFLADTDLPTMVMHAVGLVLERQNLDQDHNAEDLAA